MELNYEALGERINLIRKEKGITQSVLAQRVGIEPSNISHIERAADCTPKELRMLTDLVRAMKDSMRKRDYDSK